MHVSVAYAEPEHQEWIEFEAPEGVTAREAIRLSGITGKFPHLDPDAHKLGVFGKPVKPDQELREGDRVEIYRPLKADPKQARTRGKKSKGEEGSDASSDGADGADQEADSGA